MSGMPLPQDVADRLRAVMDDAMRLSIKAGFILQDSGIDLTGVRPNRLVPAGVVDLDFERRQRRGDILSKGAS